MSLTLRVLSFFWIISIAASAEKHKFIALLGGQSTWIFQGNTPLSGKNFNPDLSFGPEANFSWSGTVSIFAGVSPWKGAFFMVEPEYSNAHGMPNGSGMAGFPNGELVRVSVTGSNPPPYIARAFYHQEFALGADTPPELREFENRFFPSGNNAITFSIGKFAANDFFDASMIASDPRHHFLNWALMEQGAWDYPADVRGYTYGVILGLEKPLFALRAGVALMPKVANGLDLNWNLIQSRSEIIEAQVRYWILKQPGSLKLMMYFNHAPMGNYDQALESAQPNMAPDIIATRAETTLKVGLGVLMEQQINNQIAAFLRAGFNDGQTETFAFTEIDRSLSIGAHMTGAYWNRPKDRLALAVAVSGLSASHARYLAAGGKGFQLGDGGLDDAWETILETYYMISLAENIEASADIQGIFNPGMNAGHSPTAVFGLRLHGHY
ncbi:MAG: carbohydrate porin [Myxococcaceae bacterium]